MNGCELCGRELWAEGISDEIALCHPCYVLKNTKDEVEILINYHREQADEAVASNEFDAVRLHDYLYNIAKRVQAQIQDFEPIWRAEITSEMVKGWKAEAIENLKDSLDQAVQMTCEQVATEFEEEGF